MAKLIEPGKFKSPVDRAEVARDWQKRGYSCAPFTDPPGREWNDFRHATNELVTVVDGELRLSIGDDTLVCRPGDEVFIPKGAVHSVKNVARRTTRWLFGYD
jgi:quercetin dioxygenase-like cupin family protein